MSGGMGTPPPPSAGFAFNGSGGRFPEQDLGSVCRVLSWVAVQLL